MGGLSSAYSRQVTHFNYHLSSLVTCPCEPLVAPTCLPAGPGTMPFLPPCRGQPLADSSQSFLLSGFSDLTPVSLLCSHTLRRSVSAALEKSKQNCHSISRSFWNPALQFIFIRHTSLLYTLSWEALTLNTLLHNPDWCWEVC